MSLIPSRGNVPRLPRRKALAADPCCAPGNRRGASNVRAAGAGECRAGVSDREDLPRAVVSEEVEKLVPDRSAALFCSELLLLVDGLCIVARRLIDRVKRVQARITQVIEQVAVHGIGAGFRHGVYDAARGLAELRAVVTGADAELLDRIETVSVRSRRTSARASEKNA